jgi:putative ABC transport system permease protein
MPVRLALLALLRHPARTLLAILGVAVSAALLLDMVMLATGMRENFRDFLTLRGYQLRVAPRGTLPFDSEATLDSAGALVRTVRTLPGVRAVSPVLGAQSQALLGGDSVVTGFALGLEPDVQGDYDVVRGADLTVPDAAAIADDATVGTLVANAAWLARTRLAFGDTVRLAVGYDPQLRTVLGERRFVVRGEATFHYVATAQPALALPLPVLQAMGGPERRDRVSLLMVKAADGVDADGVVQAIQRAAPRTSAISLAGATAQVEQRLAYFKQLALVLGSISLAVGVLLVTTLVTISVNERQGEIAVLRAIGIARGSVVAQVFLEGLVIAGLGSILGLGLGLVTGEWLEGILRDFPGMPPTFRFFVFQPRDAGLSLLMLTVAGVVSGLFPAFRAASLPIATTLRREAVA